MRKITLLFFMLLCLGIGKGKAQYKDMLNFNYGNGSSPQGNLTISGGRLYGMTPIGGADSGGVIFSMDTNGSGYKILLNFNGINGAIPYGSLTIVGSTLYGMTNQGGADSLGLIFSIDTDGSGFRDLFDFDSANGSYPNGSLTLYGNKFYGMTRNGGRYDVGLIFSIDTSGNDYRVLMDFNDTNGAAPVGDLTISDNKMYGMTPFGGIPNGSGNIFSIDTDGSGYKDLMNFNNGANGSEPQGNLTILNDTLYGMTGGGTYNSAAGNIFSIDTNGNRFNILLYFTNTNCSNPFGSLTLSGNKFYGMAQVGGTLGGGVIFSINSNGIGFKEMFDFNRTNLEGNYPYNSLTLSGNSLYGMTQYGGADSDGVIFKLDTSSLASINNLTTASSSINVFPNPSPGIFTIAFVGAQNFVPSIIEIYNVMGQRVESKKIKGESEEIDLSSQPNGVYLYRVLDENGALIGEGKMVIEK